MITIADVADLVGVPYLIGGRDPAVGMDCWALVREVMQRAGRPVDVDWHPSCDEAATREAIALIKKETSSPTWYPVDWQPWAVILMGSPRTVHHAGVTLPDTTVLHAGIGHGSVREAWVAVKRQYGRVQCYRSIEWDK